MFQNLKTKIFLGVLVAIVAMYAVISYRSEPNSFQQRNPAGSTYTVMGNLIPLHMLESIPQDEPQAIEATNHVFENFFRKTYLEHGPLTDRGSGIVTTGTRRGVHPKAHGCLMGTMTINSHIDTKDRVGIFSEPAQVYKVMARFSNGNSRPNAADSVPDARGFGLKVYGIKGPVLLANIAGATGDTQDFTMVSGPTFFADTASHYERFMEIALNETTNFSDAAAQHIKETAENGHPILAWRVAKSFLALKAIKTSNPAAIPYFAITAFQHGPADNAPLVKYSVQPCNPVFAPAPDESDPDFLRHNLKAYAKNNKICYKFMVMNRLDSSDYPVEDSTVLWDETQSPYRELARIELPAQELVDDRVCETSVINPWNTLLAHKPVGGINRLRLAAYLMSIESRKKTNGY